MSPGRELDALIAEKIFNLYRLPDSKARDIDPQLASNFKATGYYGPLYRSQDGKNTIILPSYSTDIAAAWEVVEKMRNLVDDRPGYNDEFFTVQRTDELWRAGYMCFIDWTLDVRGETAPHAICLAALKAVGVDV